MYRDDHKDHECHDEHEKHDESEKSYEFEECNMKPFMGNYYPMCSECPSNYEMPINQMSSPCGMNTACPLMQQQMPDMYSMPMEYSDESDDRFEDDIYRDYREPYSGQYYMPYYGYQHHPYYHHHHHRPYFYPFPIPYFNNKWYK